MPPKAFRILLISDDPVDAAAVREGLAHLQDGSFTVEWVRRLAAGLERLSRRGIAAILLDLRLPDSQGIACFDQVWRATPYIPILVIGSADDQDVARQAVKRGAQDYLQKTHLDSYTLPRALRHVIERKAAEEALFLEQQRAEVTLNSIGDAVLSTDVSGHVTYLNLVAERMTGWSREEAFGRHRDEVFQIIDSETREPSRHPMDAAVPLYDTVGLTAHCLLIRRDGSETAIEDSTSPIHDRRGQAMGAVIVFRDVTALRALSLHAIHLARHDFLTDLPNRMLLNDRLTQAIALAHRHGNHLAVLFLDLDGFKHVNDSLGHVIGDALLKSVAARLVTCSRGSDTVSRQGGDEFVVLLSEIEHTGDAVASAERIIAALLEPHSIANHHLHVTASIGISVYPDDGSDADTLIMCADTAMYHAKNGGRSSYRRFERAMNARAVERQWIEAALHRGLAQHQFVLHYQPKIDLETGAMTGAEALIRWAHPQRGLMLPNEFVSIAENCGLMIPIGQWVVSEACRQVRAWIDEGRPPMPVAINVSAVEFRDPRFLDHVRAALDDSRLDARYLELELTESSLMQHAESSALALKHLKEMGVKVAIDDFGTGYSSLSYLRQFQIDALKVDQSFVHEINTHPAGTPIVSAVISMGRSLGHRVIAEGVETREQCAFLRGQRCGEGQGYYFSRPVVAAEFSRLLETGLPAVVLH
jgi:diguanylate cyclase (GGDEF)-like protein/PAS domain S-box-containing protein